MVIMDCLGTDKEVPISLERFIDIESLIGKEETDSHLVYFLSDMGEGVVSPMEEVRSQRLKETVNQVLQTLTEREEKVLRMRFGAGDVASKHTLEEVGSEFAVTRERIRPIEARAMSKLRHPSSDTGARDLLTV